MVAKALLSLRRGCADDASQLSALIFASAPILLPYLFSGEQAARDYLAYAVTQENGQYSASSHCVAVGKLDCVTQTTDTFNEQVLGCITMWSHNMDEAFHAATLKSITEHLSLTQVKHLLNTNPKLVEVFAPPLVHELCLGHIAVHADAQGLGIGKKLIAYAIREAKIQQKQQLVLDVDINNHNAISFYEGCGFSVLYERLFAPTQQVFARMIYAL